MGVSQQLVSGKSPSLKCINLGLPPFWAIFQPGVFVGKNLQKREKKDPILKMHDDLRFHWMIWDSINLHQSSSIHQSINQSSSIFQNGWLDDLGFHVGKSSNQNGKIPIKIQPSINGSIPHHQSSNQPSFENPMLGNLTIKILPQAFCEVEPETCFASTALSGCAPQKPCWPLEVDDCAMDRSGET